MAAVELRALTRADFPALSRWFAEPHVALWWQRDSSPRSVERRYGPRVDGREPTRVFAITLEGRAIGLIQVAKLTDHPWTERGLNAVEIDYLIGEPQLCGQGFGAAAIRLCTKRTFRTSREITTIVAAPQYANTASRRALEKAGFGLVEVRPHDPDGPNAGPIAIYQMDRPGILSGVLPAETVQGWAVS